MVNRNTGEHTLQGEPHLFECELKLSCVQEELEEDPGVVLGVVEHLVFNLTQSFVVWIIGCGKITNHMCIYVISVSVLPNNVQGGSY